ncbi:MAG: hypothetical protein U5M50_02150 [Sphingobium sp.]|nr:hypothetical protein [Sphingobium sp.]
MIENPGAGITVRHDCGHETEIPVSWYEPTYPCACGVEVDLTTEDVAALQELAEKLRMMLAALKVAREQRKKRPG